MWTCKKPQPSPKSWNNTHLSLVELVVHLPAAPVCLPSCQSVCPVCPSVYQHFQWHCLDIKPPFSIFNFLSNDNLCLTICLSVYLTVCLSVQLPVCAFQYSYSVIYSRTLSTFSLSVLSSVHQGDCLSAWVSCLSTVCLPSVT